MRANAKKYSVDASKIAMFGESAGACSIGVAMLLEADYKHELTPAQVGLRLAGVAAHRQPTAANLSTPCINPCINPAAAGLLLQHSTVVDTAPPRFVQPCSVDTAVHCSRERAAYLRRFLPAPRPVLRSNATAGELTAAALWRRAGPVAHDDEPRGAVGRGRGAGPLG